MTSKKQKIKVGQLWFDSAHMGDRGKKVLFMPVKRTKRYSSAFKRLMVTWDIISSNGEFDWVFEQYFLEGHGFGLELICD